MKVLAIDFGEKHIGLAVGETETRFVAPLSHFTYGDTAELYTRIGEALLETGAKKIVVGLPLSFGFRATKASKRVKEFAQEIRARFKVPIEFENEVLTSALASRYLGYAHGKKREERKSHAFAAALILEGYFERIQRYKH